MPEWEDGTCNEKSGFLFKHECFQPPSAKCQQCEKPICEEHVHELPEGMFCTSCARGQITSRGSAAKREQSGNSPSLANSNYRDPYYHDPYLYGSSYYYGYHYGGYSSHSHRDSSSTSPLNDPADFTEADGGTFEIERDENFSNDQFEKDMGES